MANKSLLNAVNEILKRTGIIAGDAGLLVSLTDSPRQVDIDQAVQVVNEGIDELYSTVPDSKPDQQKEATVTLLLSTRAYALATDLSQMHWPLIDKTNRQYIYEYAAGYDEMLRNDPEQSFTGLPYAGCIRPTDSKLFLDRAPTSIEVGKVYTYQYDKNLGLSLLGDTVPFGDDVFRAMVPAWVQLWKREMRSEFDKDLFQNTIGRASRLLNPDSIRESYSPR